MGGWDWRRLWRRADHLERIASWTERLWPWLEVAVPGVVLMGSWLAAYWAELLTYAVAGLIGMKGLATLVRRRRAKTIGPPDEPEEPEAMRLLRLAVLVAQATLERRRLYRLDHGGKKEASLWNTFERMNRIGTIDRAESELAKHGIALPPEEDVLELLDLIVAGKLERASGRFPRPRFPRRSW